MNKIFFRFSMFGLVLILSILANPRSLKAAPVLQDTAPTTTEIAPTPTEVAPTPTEVTPTPTEAAPASTEVAPAPTEVAPTPTEAAPTPTEAAPAPTEVAPAPTEVAPLLPDFVPLLTEEAPPLAEVRPLIEQRQIGASQIAAPSAVRCECVIYIKNFFGITWRYPVGDAWRMGDWLTQHGFSRISGPELGAVAILQPGFLGSNAWVGHVGLVSSFRDLGSQWQVALKSANWYWGTKVNDEYGCNNLTSTWMGSGTYGTAFSKTDTRIAFYKETRVKIATVLGSRNMVLTLEGANQSGSYLYSYPDYGLRSQKFSLILYRWNNNPFYRIVARPSGMCVQPENSNQGARLLQRPCDDTNLQSWLFQTNNQGYTIWNLGANKMIDLAGWSLNTGTWIISWPYGGWNALNQQWKLYSGW